MFTFSAILFPDINKSEIPRCVFKECGAIHIREGEGFWEIHDVLGVAGMFREYRNNGRMVTHRSDQSWLPGDC